MQETDIATLLREGMIVTLKIGGPPLLVALVVGLLMALVQAVTQINEQTLTFLPKVVGIALTLVVLGTFMTASLIAYTHTLFDRMVAVGGQ
jgi:flagellar biosynthetic protein FliQ